MNDRRNQARVPFEGEAVLCLAHEQFTVSCVDLSAGGVAVYAPRQPRRSERLKLRTQLGPFTFTGEAEVVRAHKRGASYVWGLQFVDLDANMRVWLRDQVERRRRALALQRQAEVFTGRVHALVTRTTVFDSLAERPSSSPLQPRGAEPPTYQPIGAPDFDEVETLRVPGVATPRRAPRGNGTVADTAPEGARSLGVDFMRHEAPARAMYSTHDVQAEISGRYRAAQRRDIEFALAYRTDPGGHQTNPSLCVGGDGPTDPGTSGRSQSRPFDPSDLFEEEREAAPVRRFPDALLPRQQCSPFDTLTMHSMDSNHASFDSVPVRTGLTFVATLDELAAAGRLRSQPDARPEAQPDSKQSGEASAATRAALRAAAKALKSRVGPPPPPSPESLLRRRNVHKYARLSAESESPEILDLYRRALEELDRDKKSNRR